MLNMLREQQDRNQEESFVEVNFYFCSSRDQDIELCSIKCKDELVLHVPSAKAIEVDAYRTVLRGTIPACVERMAFSGKVYPFIETGWDRDEPNNQCFENLKKLKSVDGSLRGDICWSFRNCISLEGVHLSNGIKTIPAYAFSNCVSLRDLYIRQ